MRTREERAREDAALEIARTTALTLSQARIYVEWCEWFGEPATEGMQGAYTLAALHDLRPERFSMISPDPDLVREIARRMEEGR